MRTDHPPYFFPGDLDTVQGHRFHNLDRHISREQLCRSRRRARYWVQESGCGRDVLLRHYSRAQRVHEQSLLCLFRAFCKCSDEYLHGFSANFQSCRGTFLRRRFILRHGLLRTERVDLINLTLPEIDLTAE